MGDSETERSTFGNWLRQKRRALDLTQEAFADEIGCARITLRRIESDALKPSKELALLLLEKAGIAQNELEAWLPFARGLGDPPLKQTISFPAPQRNNLPASLTTFIGREKEQVDVIQLITKHRLVTLTGSGGVGKTRLSIQAAADLLAEYPIGIWLVELAPLTDPALVPQSVCAVMGVKPDGDTSALEALTNYLRNKKLLLVLDNCEHLIDACAQLCNSLLRSCPDLRILASSRESLDIDGEHAYRVPSLSLPNSKSILNIIQESEAVTLFVERASSVQPEFALTETNAPFIAQICQRLDGIALAIELAASRIKMFKVEQIAARLDDAFGLLTSGNRTALPRQQTLRALIDWSYNLLSEEEKIFLRKLSVFVGGWTLEAAEAVCQNKDALELLTHLVDKSLVSVDHKHGDEVRYYLLETIRQYAHEKLMESGDGDSTRERHLEYFMQLAETNEARRKTPEQMLAYQQMRMEFDNFRIALDWSLSEGMVGQNSDKGLRLANAIEWEEAMEEGLNWYKKGLAKIKHGIPEFDLIRAKGMTNLGVLLIFLGERVSAVDLLQGSLALYRSINPQDKRGWLETHSRLVDAYIDYDSSVAITNAKASVALARSLGPEGIWELGTALYWDGVVSLKQREYETAKSRTQESLTIFRQLGDNIWVAHMLELLGAIESDQGNFEAARLYHEQSRDIYLALNMKRNEINALWYIASIARRTGHFDSARITLEEVIIYYRDKGLKNDLARFLWELGETLFRLGETAKATRTLQESLELLLHVTHPRYKGYGLFTLAQVFHHQENNEDAARLLGAIEVEVRKDLWQLYAPRMADYNQTMEAIKTALGEGAYTIAYAEGQAMTLDQAISYVLELPL